MPQPARAIGSSCGAEDDAAAAGHRPATQLPRCSAWNGVLDGARLALLDRRHMLGHCRRAAMAIEITASPQGGTKRRERVVRLGQAGAQLEAFEEAFVPSDRTAILVEDDDPFLHGVQRRPQQRRRAYELALARLALRNVDADKDEAAIGHDRPHHVEPSSVLEPDLELLTRLGAGPKIGEKADGPSVRKHRLLLRGE